MYDTRVTPFTPNQNVYVECKIVHSYAREYSDGHETVGWRNDSCTSGMEVVALDDVCRCHGWHEVSACLVLCVSNTVLSL